ncbi:MAG TPA: response regulator transcription factor [Aggregatilineales bacterium]|jgi:DNA-binding NarL/FixJ family response regulator|nr:response regulator transcription factor [Aggregatilineales bacterium]
MTNNDDSRIIRVALVDDHGIVRQGLRALLTRPGIEVIGEAENGEEAVELARTLRPDVMLLDIRMKESDGLQALPQIKAVSPRTSVIMLTTYANPGYLARAISGGASGYLSKETDPDQIVRAVQAAAAGDELIDRTLLRAALEHAVDPSPPSPEPTELEVDPLSDREREVLRLIVSGLSNQAIGDALSISVPTVKTHVQHILQKLHVSDRTQAALLAVRHHLLD